MEENIIKPIHFVDNKEDIITKKKDSNEEEAKLKVNCKYGKLELNLAKLPIIGNLFE